MDPLTAAGSATAGAVVIKVLDKLPWSKMFGRNVNGSAPASKDAVRAIVAEHQTGCTTGIYRKIDDNYDRLSRDVKSVETTIVNMLLQDRNGK